jgi:hypothetical protein
MSFPISVVEVDQQYSDDEAKEFAAMVEVDDPQGIINVLNTVKVIGAFYVREKYIKIERNIDSDLEETQRSMNAIKIAIEAQARFSNEAQDDLNHLAALERKDLALGPIERKDELTAQFDITDLSGQSVLFVPSSPKKGGKQSLYFVNGVGEILDTTINQAKIHIEDLEKMHDRLSQLETKYLLMAEGNKSRSGAEFFAIDMHVTFYENTTGRKGGRSYRPDKSGPHGQLLKFVEKALVRLRPPNARHRSLDHALRRVLEFREQRRNDME